MPEIKVDHDPVFDYVPIGTRDDLPVFIETIRNSMPALKSEMLDLPADQAVIDIPGNITEGETERRYNGLVIKALGLESQTKEFKDEEKEFIPPFLLFLLDLTSKPASEHDITELEDTYLYKLKALNLTKEETEEKTEEGARKKIIEIENLVKTAVIKKVKGGKHG